MRVDSNESHREQGFSLSSSLHRSQQRLTKVKTYNVVPQIANPKFQCLSSTFWELLLISLKKSQSKKRSIVSETIMKRTKQFVSSLRMLFQNYIPRKTIKKKDDLKHYTTIICTYYMYLLNCEKCVLKIFLDNDINITKNNINFLQ